MKKKALLAILLVMTLMLSSCAIVVKDKEVDAKTVILKMGDKEITKGEVQEATQNVLAEMYQTYVLYYGMELDITDPSVVESAQAEAVNQLKQDMVLRAKAVELGLDQLSDDENAQAKEDAQKNLETAKSYIQNYYLSDEEKGLEGEELENAIRNQLDLLGVSLEDYEKTAVDQVVDQKLKDYVIKDVAVPEEDVRADYDAKVAADQEKYSEDLSSWASADRNGTTLYYTPAGIRRVKQILIKFKEDAQAAIDDANGKVTAANSKISAAQKILDDAEASEEDKTQAEADLEAANAELTSAQEELKAATDAAFINLDADADAVLEALNEDPDSWDQLQEEKNEDPGMKAGAVNAEKGYAVCEGMSGFDSAFVDAAMALESVGSVSGKIRGESYGYYIIKYVGDETEGPVEYETVKDNLHDTLLTSKQNDTYTATVEQWIKDAGIKENLGALKD